MLLNFENELPHAYITTTDEALKLYNRVHEAVDQPQMHLGKEPDFKDYYKPSSSQKTGEIAYVAGGMVVVVYLASKFI